MVKDRQESQELMASRGGKKILVVGAGLAGSLFAAEAALAGHKLLVYDVIKPNSASRVAAGLYNIITGRHANLNWEARTLLDALNHFLDNPAFQSLRQHFHSFPIYRPYRLPEDFNEWSALSTSAAFRDLVEHIDHPIHATEINNRMGGLKILPCGWADVPALMKGIHEILQHDFGVEILASEFPYDALDPDTGSLEGKGKFDAIVFAEGIGVKQNHWFSDIDLRPLKGQILELETDGWEADFVLMRKSFILPISPTKAVSGSTYEHSYHDDLPNEEGREELLSQVKAALNIPVRVVGMRAGLRPTTPNRRPILGNHPNFPKLHILNGLGTKGLLQAPWCAATLRAWMDKETESLPESVDVARFFPKFALT